MLNATEILALAQGASGEYPGGKAWTADLTADLRVARCAVNGFAAIAAGDPDEGDPFDTGVVDSIANALIAAALDPNATRDLREIVRVAADHAETELRAAGVEFVPSLTVGG